MSVTIGLVANVYNEVHALPGWLETHVPFFDDVRILHAGPDGEYSNDGTLELLRKWHVPVEFCAIDDGFGVVRSRALRMSPCDWVMLLDADERFYPIHQEMSCSGDPTPHSEVDAILQSYDFRDLKSREPDWNNLGRLGDGLRVEKFAVYNQGARLRELIKYYLSVAPFDAIATIRRHWHDFSFNRPTQNWHLNPDCQMRLVRNVESIHFAPEQRMHERLVGAGKIYYADSRYGPFFDHFHFTFKRMEMKQRSHDVAIFDAIHEGKEPPTQEEFDEGIR